MADVNPFRGWRYDLGQVGSLSDVTAPPYDVISPEQQRELYDLHPCNVIRLILNRDEPGDTDPEARYRRAATFLRHWESERILLREHEDALYVYHQEFDWEGRHYVRQGFMARVRIEEFGKGKIYPHEQTLAGPKADRLALTKACKMNLSPVFGLYPDPAGEANAELEQAVIGATPLVATDHLGVVHRMWPVTNVGVINAVRAQLRDVPIFIADGHHRYETANTYRNWLKEQGQYRGESDPSNFVLMMLVGNERSRPGHPADAPTRVRSSRPFRGRIGPRPFKPPGRRSDGNRGRSGPKDLAPHRAGRRAKRLRIRHGVRRRLALCPRHRCLADGNPGSGSERRLARIGREPAAQAGARPSAQAALPRQRAAIQIRAPAAKRRPTPWPPSRANSPAWCRRPASSTSKPSPRSSRRCRPKARTSIRSSCPAWSSTR